MLSGSILGAILRAIGIARREKAKESYKDLSAIAGVWALFMFVISLLVLLLGTTIFGTFLETSLTWLFPANVIESITGITGFATAFWMALVVGVSSFVSLFIGAGIVDIAHSITEKV